ncbi:hypothetical protein [Sphingobium sp. AP50]|uniref:hypothetical protein n=1 Tax=Sphingobium sp. AP50 TaxID=1884369 RepID=UPI000B872B62|nr:hypothetical protein [Sphingobium sp. AP50]
MPGISEQCLETIKYGGILAMPETDQCFEMTTEKRWKGIWRKAFEVSRFCPAPASACSYETDGDRIWLSGKAPVYVGNDDGLYAIEFVGKQTVHKGKYGHMGAFDHEIIADKVISLRLMSADANSRP